MRHLYAVLAVLCLFALGACGEFENEDDGDVKSSEFVHSQSLADSVEIQVQPTVEPERYLVFFSWPRIAEQQKLRIRRDETLALVPPDQNTFSQEVDHNQSITYRFEVLDEDSLVEMSFFKTIEVPRDFVVRPGQAEFDKDQRLNVQRLFLNAATPLRTNGFRVEIVTDELLSDDGLIESFPPGSKATASTDGKGGGELLIRADRAGGQVKVIMRGQHGGDGVNGEPYAQRASDGRAPGEGLRRCEPCHMCEYSSPIQLLTFGLRDITSRLCDCSKVGKAGTNGANGAKGRSGTRAGHGGRSGQLRVEIRDGSEFLLKTDYEVGHAGVPGRGGEGQPGGIAPDRKGECTGRKGTNGIQGPHGDSGAKAVDGERDSICVFIASEGKNDCY